MGSKPQPAPVGYDVVKVGARWLILITPRGPHGELLSFGFIADPDRVAGDGRPLPATFGRRGQAITYAQFHQLAEENAQLRRQIQGRSLGAGQSVSGPRKGESQATAGAAGAAGGLAAAGV